MTAPGKNRPSARLGILVGGLVSVALLGFLFWGLQWGAFLQALRAVDAWLLLGVGAVVPVTLWMRACRWRTLLPGGTPFATKALYDATAVGMLANILLPLRVGEFVRAWVVSLWQPVSSSTAFAAIVIERVFDVLSLLLLLALILPQIEHAPPLLTVGAQALGGVAAGIVIVMVLSYLFEARVLALYRAVATRVLRHTELRIKLDRAVEEFLSGLRGISSVGELLGVCLWSVLIWLCYGGAYHLGLHAFGLDAPFWVALAVNVMIALAVAAPSAPGFIGTFQAGCYVALVTVYKQPPEFALAYAIVVHAVQLLAMVVCGFLSLTGRGMGLRSLRPPTA